MFKYEDGRSIQLAPNNKIIIKSHDESFEFDETDKPKFDNGFGETVIEYSGLSTNSNTSQSWAKATYKPEAYSELHYHQKRTEDYYIISGQAKVMIDGKEYRLSPGDHIQILPGQQHQVINKSKQEALKLIVKCVPSWIKDDFHVIHSAVPRPNKM